MSGTRRRYSQRARREQELYDEAMARVRLSHSKNPMTTAQLAESIATVEGVEPGPVIDPRTLAHTADPETSKHSAHDGQNVKASHRRACLEAHRAASPVGVAKPKGLTDGEVADKTGLELIEARRRCSDLRSLGLIQWRMHAGAPVFGKTALGKRARVSIITSAGREALQ